MRLPSSSLYSSGLLLLASPAVMTLPTEIATWWGRHRLPVDRTDKWNLGLLELMVEHHENFWRVHWRHVARETATNSRSMGLSLEEVSQFSSDLQPPAALSPYFHANRHAVTIPTTNPNEDLIFSPVLPDASLVLALQSEAVVDPGEKLVVGFQIPLFLCVETAAGQAGSRDVCEISLSPLVRTWAGPNPLNGELALTTNTRSSIDRWAGLKPRLDVAGVSVTIGNPSDEPAFVDQILVPCSRLALYHSPQTGFWCESLLLDASTRLGGMTSVRAIERSFPREAGTTTLVTHARHQPPAPIALKGLASFRSTIGNSVGKILKE